MTQRKETLVPFMLLACGFSWCLWLLMIASNRGLLPFRFPTTPLGSFGPSLAALFLAWRDPGTDLRRHLRSLFLRRPGLRWVAFAFLLPVGITALSVLAHRIGQGSVPSPQQLDKAFWLLPIFAIVFVVGGPLGEELGWRGHALPRLLTRHRPLIASLILAAMWVLWHLPLFWLDGAAQSGSSILLFLITVASLSVVFTWLYLQTRPSLAAVLLLHTSINVTSIVLPAVLPGVDASQPYNVAFVAVTAVLAVALAIDLERTPVRSLQAA